MRSAPSEQGRAVAAYLQRATTVAPQGAHSSSPPASTWYRLLMHARVMHGLSMQRRAERPQPSLQHGVAEVCRVQGRTQSPCDTATTPRSTASPRVVLLPCQDGRILYMHRYRSYRLSRFQFHVATVLAMHR